MLGTLMRTLFASSAVPTTPYKSLLKTSILDPTYCQKQYSNFNPNKAVSFYGAI